MVGGLDFSVVRDNLSYFFVGRYPKGSLGGVGLTLYLAVVSLALSFIGGLVLGLLSVSRNRLLRWGSMTVIQTIRGMPLLMVIFWMFFLLPAMLGGGMVPLFVMPPWMLVASNVSPAKWAILGLEGALWRGFSPAEMALPCVILVGVGFVCFALGARAFRTS